MPTLKTIPASSAFLWANSLSLKLFCGSSAWSLLIDGDQTLQSSLWRRCKKWVLGALLWHLILNFSDNKPRILDNNIVSSMLINIFSHWAFKKISHPKKLHKKKLHTQHNSYVWYPMTKPRGKKTINWGSLICTKTKLAMINI